MKDIVINYLRKFTSHLPSLYTWNPNENILLDRFGIDISKFGTAFEKNLQLKIELTKNILKNGSKENKINIANYIIREWGGIRRFNKGVEIVTNFENIEFSETLPNYHFNYTGISSWSKYLSLIAPNWACIYDARVAYSLNVINYISGANHSIFPIPSGRNSKILLLDIETLLLASKIQETNTDSPKEIRRKHYIIESEVYPSYIKLINELHCELWKSSDPVQYTEMLLFAISDTHVYHDLLNFFKRN